MDNKLGETSECDKRDSVTSVTAFFPYPFSQKGEKGCFSRFDQHFSRFVSWVSEKSRKFAAENNKWTFINNLNSTNMEEEKDNKLAEEQLEEANGGRPYNLYNKRPHQ